jgi:hypothetical protein
MKRKKISIREYFRKRGLSIPESLDAYDDSACVPPDIADYSSIQLEEQLAKWTYLSNRAEFLRSIQDVKKAKIEGRISIKKLREEDSTEDKAKLKVVKSMIEAYKSLYRIYQNNYKTVSRIVTVREKQYENQRGYGR